MKHVLLMAGALGIASIAFAQTPNSGTGECSLTLAQAPSIRGVRLGMTINQALAAIPGAEADSNLQGGLSRNHFGFQSVRVAPGSYVGSKEKFNGIDSITFEFLDGKLVRFSVGYDGPEWRSKEQFAASVAETLKLPEIGNWKPTNDGLGLGCTGFEISVKTGYPVNWIAMRDPGVDINKIVREREEVPKEKARRAFKP